MLVVAASLPFGVPVQAVLCDGDQSGNILDLGLGCTTTYKLRSCAHSIAASPDTPMVAPLQPNHMFKLAPLPHLQVTSHWLHCPSQVGGTAPLVVDSRLDKTFVVDLYTRKKRFQYIANRVVTFEMDSTKQFCGRGDPDTWE